MPVKAPRVCPVASLFDRLGGKKNIATAVEKFYKRVLADPELRPFFAKTNMNWLRMRQTQFMTQALGGPAEYKGKTMKAAHADMLIERRHFDRVGEHLSSTLKEMGVPADVVGEVMKTVASLEPDIVTVR